MRAVDHSATGPDGAAPSTEGSILEQLWSGASGRTEALGLAADAAQRSRALNERMHRTALAALEESHAEQVAAIERDFRSALAVVEDKTVTASRKVDEDERILQPGADVHRRVIGQEPAAADAEFWVTGLRVHALN